MDKKGGGLIAEVIKKIKTNKKLEIGIYIALGLLAVILYVSSLSSGKDESKSSLAYDVSAVTVRDEDVESKLADVLSKIRGAGDVRVMITYDTTGEIVPAMSTDTQTGESSGSGTDSRDTSESKTPATVKKNGDEEPIVLTQIEPTVRGVIVIAEGAADISVKLDLQHAVETVLGVSADCIEVFEMDGANINN